MARLFPPEAEEVFVAPMDGHIQHKVRVVSTPPPRRGEPDFESFNRRVLRALRTARARRFRQLHWWGYARSEER